MKILFVLLLALGLVGCGKPQPAAPQAKPTVLVSIVPFAYFVQKIAGDTVNVEILVPRGADPHTYEPTPKQVAAAHNAKLWLRIDEPFEKKVLTVLRQTSLKTLDLWENLPLLPLEEGHSHFEEEAQDRHIWLSPKLVKICSSRIFEALCEVSPENRTLYATNLREFERALDLLDKEIAERLAPLHDKAILVSHSAFGYFCHDYHLTQLALECEGKEALPQKISHLLKEAREQEVQCAIVQGQYGSKAVELVAKELDLPIFLNDPYAWDYLENLRTLSKMIACENE